MRRGGADDVVSSRSGCRCRCRCRRLEVGVGVGGAVEEGRRQIELEFE